MTEAAGQDRNLADETTGTAGWGWILLTGILLAGLGLFALGHLALATFASIIMIGVLMIIGGIAHVVFAFRGEGWKHVVLLLLSGALYLIAGVTVFANPLLASTMITLILAAALLAAGVMRIWFGIRERRSEGWLWPVVTGVVTLLLGLSVAAGWPFNSLFIIGIFLGVDLLIQGIGYVTFALAMRRRQRG